MKFGIQIAQLKILNTPEKANYTLEQNRHQVINI